MGVASTPTFLHAWGLNKRIVGFYVNKRYVSVDSKCPQGSDHVNFAK